MDGDEIGDIENSPESIYSFEGDIENEEDKKKKIKISGFEEYEGAWERKVMPLLSCMSEMDHLYRKSGEVASNALKDKVHLLFVCFYLPPGFEPDLEYESLYPQDFIPTCLDLYSYRDDFELVLVTKMNTDDPICGSQFHDIMVPFPLSSLVVPLQDSQRRTFICDLLLDPEPQQIGFAYKCLFVNIAEKTLFVGKPGSMPSFVDHLKELLRNSSFDAQRSYHRLVKTMWPINSACLSTPPYSPIARIFKDVKPEYSDDINALVSELPAIQIGQTLDVKFLLSAGGGSNELGYLVRKDGEQVELGKAIQGKYTMICCFHAPVFRREWNSNICQSLLNTCSELYALGTNFEMVVVVKMKKLADYKQVFNHFLSGFPSSCFVIPFEDSKCRDFICKYLELDEVQCLLFDNKGTDMKKNILLYGYPRFAQSYGADAFPFTDEKLQALEADEEPTWKTSSTNNLVELLRCKPSDVLRKTNAEDGCDSLTISDLNRKDVVGLFLCAKGDLIPKLKTVYEQCKAQQKPFEILLVYIPFNDCLQPENYQLCVDKLLQEHKLSLWYMPFDNSVSHKLSRLTGIFEDDRLIIFRDQGASIDSFGGAVIRACGIDAYPFTRKELVGRELKRLRELTLETLLVYKTRTYVLKDNQQIPVADLKGKNILLWISSLSVTDMSFFEKLLIWYTNNREKKPDFEVVFVREEECTVSDNDSELSAEMPWLVCPFDADHSAFVYEKLFPNLFPCGEALVEFGTDGLVCSLRAKYLLDIGVDESGKIPFGGSDLRRDVIEYLCCRYGDLDEFMHIAID